MYHPLILMALNTGLRQGELLQLTWADIDWNVGVLTIHETKAGERRHTPMNSIVVGLLSALKTNTLGGSLERAMQGANDRTLMALGGWKSPAMLSRYAHLSPAHLWKAVEGLTGVGTVTEEKATEEEVQKLLIKVMSRLGLEPRAIYPVLVAETNEDNRDE